MGWDDDDDDDVVSQLILEFGLLSRELGKLEDFFTACLSLIELAVLQSKQRFREDATTVMEGQPDRERERGREGGPSGSFIP